MIVNKLYSHENRMLLFNFKVGFISIVLVIIIAGAISNLQIS